MYTHTTKKDVNLLKIPVNYDKMWQNRTIHET